MDKEIMTADEVAELIGYSREHVWKLTREGKIPCKRIGRGYRYRRTAINNWLEQE